MPPDGFRAEEVGRCRPLVACQAYIDRFGMKWFKRECQHEVDDAEGALWTMDRINEHRVAKPHEVREFLEASLLVENGEGPASLGRSQQFLSYR